MEPITYLIGDATNPSNVEGNKIIIHICNDENLWGAGFVLAISRKWKAPEEKYHEWHGKSNFRLGEVQFVKVEKDIAVANMIGQRSVGVKNGIPPIRYDAVNSCLKKVCEIAKKYNASIHCPRIGCGLAGGSWDEIEALLIENLSKQDIGVYVYDLQ